MFTRSTHRVEYLDTDAEPFGEAADPPVTTPEDAMGWIVPAQGAALLLAIVCAVMAALHFFF